MQDLLVLERVHQIRKELPRVGTQKLHFLLRAFLEQHQLKLGRDKLYALLRRQHLLYRKNKSRVKTTQSHHHYYKYPNLMKEIRPTKANQLWVSDITYIPIGAHYGYLSLITDAYSRMILGWSLQKDLQAKGVLQALQMALQASPSQLEGLIHHSDRGLQYCCRDYIQLLQSKGIKISMTERSDPGENALAERVNGILKEELLLHRRFFSFSEAQLAVQQAIDAYNHLRPHSSCNYLTPSQAHQQQGQLSKKWKAKKLARQKVAWVE